MGLHLLSQSVEDNVQHFYYSPTSSDGWNFQWLSQNQLVWCIFELLFFLELAVWFSILFIPFALHLRQYHPIMCFLGTTSKWFFCLLKWIVMQSQVDHALNLIWIAYLSLLLDYPVVISWIQMYLFWCSAPFLILFLFVLLHPQVLWCWCFFCNVSLKLISLLKSCCLETYSSWILQLCSYFLNLLLHQFFSKNVHFMICDWIFDISIFPPQEPCKLL